MYKNPRDKLACSFSASFLRVLENPRHHSSTECLWRVIQAWHPLQSEYKYLMTTEVLFIYYLLLLDTFAKARSLEALCMVDIIIILPYDVLILFWTGDLALPWKPPLLHWLSWWTDSFLISMQKMHNTLLDYRHNCRELLALCGRNDESVISDHLAPSLLYFQQENILGKKNRK